MSLMTYLIRGLLVTHLKVIVQQKNLYSIGIKVVNDRLKAKEKKRCPN
jgi:hypothetical protein